MHFRRVCCLWLVVGACLVAGPAAGRRATVVDLLDRYESGQFEAVVAELARVADFDDLLQQLKREAPAWLDANGPAHRDRRELVAATFALEAARADEWYEWVWIQSQPGVAVTVLYWKPPPLLIEWGCQLMRAHEPPRPIERWWQLAALAVAQRSEDSRFLVGDIRIGRAGEIINVQDEIKHLDHVMKRFPAESRFVLAQGIARDRYWEDDALTAYAAVANDADVGGEASMRLGALHLKHERSGEAILQFDRAQTLTRDPYVIYLARYFKGRVLEGNSRSDEALDEYRGAAAAWPTGQAATVSLAALLFRNGRRAEAHEQIGRMLAAAPNAFDPWREYVHADNRFWPQLIGRLRAEIRR